MVERLDARSLETLAHLLATGAVDVRSGGSELEASGVSAPPRLLALLKRVADAGLGPDAAAVLLRELARERGAEEQVVCVASGPRPLGGVRDTATVMEALFAGARERLLIIGYALHQGDRVLRTVAQRMDGEPKLSVTLCLDIPRALGDTSMEEDILARWASRFRREQWPGTRAPTLYYDPRALAAAPGDRAALHAKCVVADGRIAFVTSANLTVAAQERNVELGLLIQQAESARLIARHFDALIQTGVLRRLPL